jgi:hypothetical protein
MAKTRTVKTTPKKTRPKKLPGHPGMTEKNPAAQALGRLGGTRNTEAQKKARLKNAKRAGRPARVCVHCGEPVWGGHKDKRLEQTCPGRAWTWGHPKNRQETHGR